MFRTFLSRRVTSTKLATTTAPSLFLSTQNASSSSSPSISNNKEFDERYAKSERAKIFEGKIVHNKTNNSSRLEWKTHPEAEIKRKARALMKNKNQEQQLVQTSMNDFTHLRQMLHARISDSSLPPIKISDLFNKVTTPWRLLDEYNVPSRTKRLQRLSTILRFLQDHNVLLHAVFRFQEFGSSRFTNNNNGKNENNKPSSSSSSATGTWNVTPHFSRLVTVGETKIASEIPLRLSKVFPNATLDQLQALERSVIDTDFLAEQIFDAANLNRLVHPRDARKANPLTKSQKATLICAIVAELGWFVARTKATDRTHNNALFPPSDALILHVLAAHAVENIMGDLVAGLFFHHHSQNSTTIIPRDFRINWRNFETSLVEQVPFVLSKKKVEVENNGATKLSDIMIRTTEDFEGCFAENVDERDASLELLRSSPLILNLIKRNYEQDLSEMEKKKCEKKKELFNSDKANDYESVLAGAKDFTQDKKLDGFYSPTPIMLKWETNFSIEENNNDSSSSLIAATPKCAPVPGFEPIVSNANEEKVEAQN